MTAQELYEALGKIPGEKREKIEVMVLGVPLEYVELDDVDKELFLY